MDLFALLGRFHPVVLHLPIGAVFTVALIELWFLFQKPDRGTGRLLSFLYLVSMATTLLAIGTGLLLSNEPAYGGSTLELHENLGLATGGAILLAAGCAFLARQESGARNQLFVRCRKFFLLVSIVLITVTGHFGGEMTHGEDFLTEHAPAWLSPQKTTTEPAKVEVTDTTTVYQAAIYPILEQHCVYCHDSEKTKGGLRMDSIEYILKGGESGPLLVAGNPKESLMLQRIHLPLEDDEHMPPAKKSQPDEAAVAALTWWIANGASFDLLLSDASVPQSILALAQKAPVDKPAEVATIEELNLQGIESLRTKHITVQRVAQGTNQLWVDFSAVAPQTDDSLIRELEPISSHVVWLNLSRSRITDRALPAIQSMSLLEELNLRATAVTDAGLAQLQGLANLKRLNLSDTQASSASRALLEQLPKGATVYLHNSRWKQEEIDGLRQARPDLVLN